MYTCCPHCQTCFRITKAQLDVAQGKVRCGHCKQVFNGKQHLHDELPGQQSKPVVPAATPTPPPTTPITPEPEPQQTEEDFGKASDIDFDLFDFNSIPESSEEEEDWFEDTEETAEELEDLESESWLEDEGFDDEDVTVDLDEPDEEIDEAFDEIEEEEEEPFVDVETEDQVEESDSQAASRYAYVDPEELRGEQQDIEQFIEEMNAQLSKAVEEPKQETSLDSFVDVDLLAEPEEPFPPEEDKPSQPAAFAPDDEFKQAFLENLDSTLAIQPTAPEPAEPPPPEAEPQPETMPPPEPVIAPPPPMQPAAGSNPPVDEEIPLRLRDSLTVEIKRRRPVMLILGLLAILLFSATLFVQLAYFRSSQLLDRFPAMQPLVEQVCTALPCHYSGPRDVSQIKLVNRDIRVHPKVSNALLISATFVNRASFKQPYPDITITLSDLSGAMVAQRRFTPAEYLGRLNNPFLLMPSGKPVQIALEVVDPGKDAVNFEFTFQ